MYCEEHEPKEVKTPNLGFPPQELPDVQEIIRKNLPKPAPLLSVVIVYKDTEEEYYLLQECLAVIPVWVQVVAVREKHGETWGMDELFIEESDDGLRKAAIFTRPENEPVDFAALRNAALKLATGKWILSLDADERFYQWNQLKFYLEKVLSQHREVGGVTMSLASWYRYEQKVGGEPGETLRAGVPIVRLFLNQANIRWQFAIHEQIVPSIYAAKREVVDNGNLWIIHVGYAVDYEQYKEKLMRNFLALWGHPELKDNDYYQKKMIETGLLIKYHGAK